MERWYAYGCKIMLKPIDERQRPYITIWSDDYLQNPNFVLDNPFAKSLTKYKSDFRFTYFLEPLFLYYNFKFRTIGAHKVHSNDINWLVYPCDSFKMLKFYVKNISKTVYNFCEKNNFKIIISYYREFLSEGEVNEMEKYISEFFVNQKKESNIIKILINGFEPKIKSKYFDYFIPINFMDKLTRVFIDKKRLIKREHPYAENRKYDFSVLIGKLDDRLDRVLFFSKCYAKGLIDERFFYTIICFDKEKTYQNIIQTTYSQPSDVKQHIKNMADNLLENKIYDDNGNRLESHQHIYYQQHEFKIPIQVLDSYINIVLETRPFSPSLTEKIYKPIVSGVPFIWHGPYKTLEFLESEGYKKYPFINYSFDDEPCRFKRIDLLIEEIQRLKSLDLKNEIKNCKDIAQHNILNFYKRTQNFDEIFKKINE